MLDNFCDTARKDLGIEPPYSIEIGGSCLGGANLGIAEQTIVGPIHQNELKVRKVINDVTPESIRSLVSEFMDMLFDLAGADRSR